MSRCNHGFSIDRIPCPQGCHDNRILAALQEHATLREAGDSLDWSRVGHFHQRAQSNPAIRSEIAKRRNTQWKGTNHPAFVDMAGQTKGPWKVIKRLPNDRTGSALWLCEHDCGAQQSILGTQLRANTPKCKACQRKEASG